MTTPEKPKPACLFCNGTGTVENAQTWIDGKKRPPLPCPRCGGQPTKKGD
jgi:DnaJ-class molecular chaperone